MGLKELIFGGAVKDSGTKSAARPGSIQEWLPIKNIVHGIIVTSDLRFVKVLEVLPVNFYTLSDTEKDNVIADFASYLKIAPNTIQIDEIVQKFDLDGYIAQQKSFMESESNDRCREMIEDNISMVTRVVHGEAITHRFFLSFEYEPQMKARNYTAGGIAERLNEVADTTRRYLDRCGIEVLEPEYGDNATLELLYERINKRTSRRVKLPAGVFDMLTTVHGVYE